MLFDSQHRRALLLSLLATTLVACGGGGGDDDEDEDVDPPDNDEDASGLWLGTANRSGTASPFAVIASPNGDFAGVVLSNTGTGRLLVGSGTVTGNKLNASGTIFASAGGTLPGGNMAAAVTIPAATIVEGLSLSGSYSGGGEVAIVNLNFDRPKTQRGASLATLAGTYTTFPFPTAQGATITTITIQNVSGATTFATSTGCNGTGTFSIPDAAYNIYAWTIDVGACGTIPAMSFRGLATLDDNPNGGTNNLLHVYGATLNRGTPYAFIGSK